MQNEQYINYKCHICSLMFREDDHTYWKDKCGECNEYTCIACRDTALETDYDDGSICNKCAEVSSIRQKYLTEIERAKQSIIDQWNKYHPHSAISHQ